jgi:glycosyltransferase involved in cell wall biosynthesis
MNVLVVHNFYQQPGGEDAVFRDEVRLLGERGHRVRTHTVHNEAVASMGNLALARKTIWNADSYRRIYHAAREIRADVVHFHNTLPLISPAGYQAARDAGSAVVQTLHNYRLSCPAATFFRDGKVCEKCLGRSIPLAAVRHKCYRDSRLASAVVATMLARHRWRGTYRTDVDVYIALTEFARDKMVAGGIPREKVVVKPNFVDPDPGPGDGEGDYVLFVGRLSPEKGIDTLLTAWEHSQDLPPLCIAGDGPEREAVLGACRKNARVRYLGRVDSAQVLNLMGSAKALVFPSVWYEGQPRTIIESFARGTPVIASAMGSMRELIEPDVTGKLFTPGDAIDLARVVNEALSDPSLGAMRQAARRVYERHYTAQANHEQLCAIYHRASRWRAGFVDKSDNALAAGPA